MKKLLYFLFAFTFISCGNKIPEETFIDFKPNKNIISFKITDFLNDKYSDKRPDSLFSRGFDPKTDTIKYQENEIYISCIIGLTGCVKYDGDMEIKKDSMLLKLVTINNIACPELEITRVVFRIKNPRNEKYKFGKYIK
ncbi:MAG: hypothetical protein ACOVLG_10475 [Flavobacterium sp.]